jgi:D-serine deaminase-like pyridoxal phosphate-dependent protein
MDPRYLIQDPATIFSPALLFYKELIEENLQHMVRIAGRPERLRPHAKTHKTREITRLALAAGVRKHKCATIAEAEMLAECGVPDVLIAYPIIGPNCARMVRLAAKYPATCFSVLADHPLGLAQLSAAAEEAKRSLDVLIDINIGQNRTGVAPGDEAIRLYEALAKERRLRPAGLHVYDGHNSQERTEDRKAAVCHILTPVLALREALLRQTLPLPRIVFGGTPTFPAWAEVELPEAELSPGTCVLHDAGYGGKFAEMPFTPAAAVLTRVISRPTPGRVTLDLGYKAIASDQPAGKRCRLLDVPEYREVLHNEEHLVIETPAAERFRPGDVVLAIPQHVCPTVALHQFAHVVEKGQVIDRWPIVARDRQLTV